MTTDKSMFIGIAGTGTIGTSYAALFSGNGYKTQLVGLNETEIKKSRDMYAGIFDTLEERKLVTQEQRKKCAALVSYSTRYEDISNADFVIEAVFEDLNIKHEILKKVEDNCPKLKALASATSVLAPDDLKKALQKYRSKLVIAHPINPAYLVPFVELVGCTETSAETMQFVKGFLETCGRKVCLMKKSVPGFIVNRLQHAMVREALYLIQEGVTTPEDIDMALTWSFAPRYTKIGLLEHQDGYGLDMLENLQNYLYGYLCNDKGASPLVIEAVKKGNLGQKTGKGLHDWSEKKIAEFRVNAAAPYWHLFNWNLPK